MAAIASTSQVTLERITELSGNLTTHMTERPIRLEKAMEAAQALHKCGLSLVNGEFSNQPFHPPVDPVVLDIHSLVLTEDLQAYHSLRGELMKTHRLFLELMWYQKWRNKEQPTLDETIVKVKEVSGLIAKTLPSEPCIAEDGALFNPVATEFELLCIGEAVKYLNPPGSEWKKYKAHARSVASAVAHIAPAIAAAAMAPVFPPLLIGACAMPVGLKLLKSVFSIVPDIAETLGEHSELFDVLTDAKEDRKATWYHDVWNFRWLCSRIDSAEGFEKVLQPLIDEFCDTGEKYAMCVVSALADLIEHNPGEEYTALRAKAYSGEGKYFGLLDLADYQKAKRWDILPGVARGKRRRKVRELAIHHLARLARNKALPKAERAMCIGAIQIRLANIEMEKEKTAKEEKEFVEQKIAELKTSTQQKLIELEQKIESIEDKLGAFDEDGNPVRGKTVEEDFEELNGIWAELDMESDYVKMQLENCNEYQPEPTSVVLQKLDAEKGVMAAFMASMSESSEYTETEVLTRTKDKQEAK